MTPLKPLAEAAEEHLELYPQSALKESLRDMYMEGAAFREKQILELLRSTESYQNEADHASRVRLCHELNGAADWLEEKLK